MMTELTVALSLFMGNAFLGDGPPEAVAAYVHVMRPVANVTVASTDPEKIRLVEEAYRRQATLIKSGACK